MWCEILLLFCSSSLFDWSFLLLKITFWQRWVIFFSDVLWPEAQTTPHLFSLFLCFSMLLLNLEIILQEFVLVFTVFLFKKTLNMTFLSLLRTCFWQILTLVQVQVYANCFFFPVASFGLFYRECIFSATCHPNITYVWLRKICISVSSKMQVFFGFSS